MPDACQYGSVRANSLDLRRASGVLDSSVLAQRTSACSLEDVPVHDGLQRPDPPCQGGVRCAVVRQQCRTGLSACLDLVPVDGDDEIGSRREAAVDRADASAGPGGDVAHGHIDAGSDESRGGRVQQCLLVTPGVGPLPRSCLQGGRRVVLLVCGEAGAGSDDRVEQRSPLVRGFGVRAPDAPHTQPATCSYTEADGSLCEPGGRGVVWLQTRLGSG
jgi:hypothetical protein